MAVNGQLLPVQRVFLHRGAKGDFNSADIHLSPDGKFLYASNRGTENNIAQYAIDQKGMLHFIAYQSVLGDHPRIFALSPDGKFLIVANQLSGNLIVFRRNRVSGKLSATGQQIKIDHPSCVQIKTYL